jgi:hypothetical protein
MRGWARVAMATKAKDSNRYWPTEKTAQNGKAGSEHKVALLVELA